MTIVLALLACSHAQAQAQLGPPTDEIEAVAGPPLLDAEAIRRLIRAELQAESEQKKAEQAEGRWEDCTRAGKTISFRFDCSDGFIAETADEAFRIHLGGRIEFDNSWFTQDPNLLIGNGAGQHLLDGTLLRRARLRADGRIWEFVEFAAEASFATIQDVSNVDNEAVPIGSVGLTDFYLGFRQTLLGNVRVGHIKAPVGLERYSSTNAWYYMERSSLYDAFLGPNNYQNGIVVFDSYLQDRVTLATCLSWIGKSTVQSFGFGANEGKYAASLRATALPLYRNDGQTLMHVGIGYQHQTLVDNQLAVASRPLLRAGAGKGQTPNLVATGTFFTQHGADIVDLEWALVLGRFALSGEYALACAQDLYTTSTFTGPRGDVTYQAAYIEGGFFLTPGDQRRYDRKTGTWARTEPQGSTFQVRGDGWHWGSGAVQLLARYTYLDLISGTPSLTPTSGGARAGVQQDVTIGLCWTINPQSWFMINHVWTHLDSVVPGAGGNLQGVGCRFHIDF